MTGSEQKPVGKTVQWCQDWPLVERLPLTVEERAALRRERIGLNILGGLVTPFFFIFFLGGIFLLIEIDITEANGLLLKAVLIVFLLLSVAPLAIADRCFKRAQAAREDLLAGEKLRFAGRLNEAMCADPLVRKLLLHGKLHDDGTETQSIEVLTSGRLRRANGLPVSGWSMATITETAAVPEIAHIAAQWLDPLDEVEGVALQGGKRELAAEEIFELRLLAKKSWRNPLLPALALSAWCFPLIGYLLWQRHFPPEWGFFLFLVSMTLLADIMLIRGLILAYRIRKDISGGIVMIVQGPVYLRHCDQVSDDGDEHTVELLPSSDFVWTVDGEPAPWRKRTGQQK